MFTDVFFSGEFEITRKSMRNIAEVKMRRGTPNHDFYIHSFTHNIQTDSNICEGTYIIKALIHRHIHTHLMNMSTLGKEICRLK